MKLPIPAVYCAFCGKPKPPMIRYWICPLCRQEPISAMYKDKTDIK